MSSELVVELYKMAFKLSSGKISCSSARSEIASLLADAAEKLERCARREESSVRSNYGTTQLWGQQDVK